MLNIGTFSLPYLIGSNHLVMREFQQSGKYLNVLIVSSCTFHRREHLHFVNVKYHT